MKLYSRMRGKNNGMMDLINDLPNNIIMAEIGCYAGESTLMFMQSSKIKHLYAIDPWCADKNGLWWRNITERSLDEKQMKRINEVFDDMHWAENSFDFRMKLFKNVTKLKMTFVEALENLPKLDFVYIDGDHSYEAVKKDIINAKKIIKSPGIIAGHDYTDDQRESVIKAVNESFNKDDLIFYRDSSWLIKIK
jgi:hypothetical protein